MRRLCLELNSGIFPRLSALLTRPAVALFVCAIICPIRSWAQWTQLQELTAFTGPATTGYGTSIGYSLALDGGTLVVGAPIPLSPSSAPQGAAYVFVQNGGTWTQQAVLTASDGVQFDDFAHSVAISGNTIVVGDFDRERATCSCKTAEHGLNRRS